MSAEGGRETPAYGFVVGTGRCGSTLVHEVLARHRDVGFVSNLDDSLSGLRLGGRWNPALYRRLPPAATVKGRLRFAPSEGYRVLARQVAPVLCRPARDLTEADATPWVVGRFRQFFESRARAQGRPLFLHKFTGWPRARFVAAALPGARFVHVVRDGRAVAASWLRMPWWDGHLGPPGWHFGPLPAAYHEEWEASGRSFVVLAGLAWKLLMDAYDEARAALPEGSWTEVRYEDVVAHPGPALDAIAEFLGLPATTDFAAQVARVRFHRPDDQVWRRDLGAHAAALEASLAGHLRRRGYRVDDGRGEAAGG